MSYQIAAATSFLAIILLFSTSCVSRELPVIKFTDVQSRRTYTSVGNPTVMLNEAVNFQDKSTGKAITLQSWEAEDDTGRDYRVIQKTNIWNGKSEYKLVPLQPVKAK